MRGCSLRRRLALVIARAVHRFTETANRSNSLFDAIPDGKPFHTFPGIALEGDAAEHAQTVALWLDDDGFALAR